MMKEDYIRELKANMEIDCPYTPKFHGLAFCKNENQDPVLITDFVKGRKLSQCYKDIVEDYPEILPKIFLEICSAICYIHDRGYFHGDLSPNNVIVYYNEEVDEVKVHIIDFGLSDIIARGGKIWGHTIDYCAYEVLGEKKPGANLDKVDIFSFGSIMFNVYFRTSFTNYFVKRFPPKSQQGQEKFSATVRACFKKEKKAKTLQKSINQCFQELPRNNLVSGKLLTLINKCLSFNPQNRPRAFDLFQALQKIFDEEYL